MAVLDRHKPVRQTSGGVCLKSLEGTYTMKSIFRTAAAGIAVATFTLASAASAATSDSAEVSAEILTALSVLVDPGADTLNFGTIADGGITTNQTLTVDPTGTLGSCATGLVCGGTTAAPAFDIEGLAGALVQVSFTSTTETLSYDAVANGGPAPGGFASTMSVGSFVTDAAFNLVTNQVQLDASGDASFSVGGTLTVVPDLAPGIYTGTLTVGVAYN